MTLRKASAKRSTSVSPDAQPRLSRIAPRASSGWTPIAASTCDGATLPDEQAEPELTATPARSSAIISVAASTPGAAKQTVLGRRGAASEKMTASATTERTASARRSRNPMSRAASLAVSGRHARAAAPKAAIAATASVPARWLRSWPPPRASGAPRLIPARAVTSAPAPFIPPILWADSMSASAPSAAMLAIHSPGHLDRVAENEAARRVNQRRRFDDRLDDAGLVVCALQRQQRAPRTAAGGLEPVEVEPAVGPQRRDLRRRKPMPGEDAGVLAGRDDEPVERSARPARRRITD